MLKYLSLIGVIGFLCLSNNICTGDVIQYDNNNITGSSSYDPMWSHCFKYYGVRFTPLQKNCKLTGGQVYIGNYSHYSQGCNFFVYNDNNGQPGPLNTQGSFTSGAMSYTWYTVTLSTQPVFNGDFFIFVAPTSPNDHLSIGLDNALDYADKMGGTNTLPGWTGSTYTGDFAVRANVTYVGIEEKSNIKMQNAKIEIYPNPFVEKTVVSGQWTVNSKIQIYDLSGKLVKSFQMTPNDKMNNLTWDRKDNNGNKVSSGMYFCKLKIDNSKILTKSLVIL